MKIAFEPDVFTQKFYEFKWIVVGNLGMEAVVGALSRFTSVEIAGQIAVGICIVLPGLGMALLSQTLHGRVTVPCIVGLVFVWNGVMQLGFVSYALGLGLATCVFAFWVATEDRPMVPRVVVGSFACALLFFAHTLAFVFYGIALFGYMAGRLIWRRDRAFSVRLIEALASGIQAVPTLVLMNIANDGGGAYPIFSSITAKASNLTYLMYSTWSAVLFVALAIFFAMILMSALTNRMPFPTSMVGPLAALTVAYLVMPLGMLHGQSVAWGVDWRLLPLIAWLALAALRDPVPPLFQGRATVSAIFLVVLSLFAILQKHWFGWVREEANLRACLQQLAPGQSVASFLFPTGETGRALFEDPPGVPHLSSWAVTDRSAYVPTLFSSSHQQPLSYKGEWEHSADIFDGPFLDSEEQARPEIIRHYDYILSLFASADRTLPPQVANELEPSICEGPHYALFPVEAAIE